MNKRGQVLVTFVLLLPIIVLFLYIFIVKSYLIYEKNRIENIANLACKSNDKEKIIQENDKSIKVIIKEEKGTTIILEKDIDKFINILRYKNIKVVKKCEE